MGTHHHTALENDIKVVNDMASTSVTKPEKKPNCTAIIWLKNSSDESARVAIASTLQTLKGVSEVHYVRKKPCIMMVDYCRNEVSSTTLVGAINIHGGLARIIGC